VSLRSRLLAPVTSALVGGLVLGLLALAPAPADAADTAANTTAVHPSKRHREQPSTAVFARSSYLCYGYVDCREKGMFNGGYAQNNKKMYWRMYSGHNCTNYAAYRMVKSGLPNERPWSGGGNATYWGSSMSRITNDVPRVGAVTWWKANTGPAGSSGHVGYVERVVSADEIVVSQDSWGGDFSWATITRGSGNWPSGFIHFNDVPLLNQTAPVVSGIAKVGSVLTATAGTWKPAGVAVAYQWFADGVLIRGATAATLKLTRAQLNHQVTVTTTGSMLGYPAKSATSTPTEIVEPGALKNVAAPTLTGEAKVDSTLTLAPGEWTPTPTALTYQWFADGQLIEGAATETLSLGPDLVDRTITATVTASRVGYDDVAVTTAATAPVAPGTFVVDTQPSLLGDALLGKQLSVDTGSFLPTDADVSIQWLRDGAPVVNATGPTYQITNVDLGSRLSARVTLTRAGYTTEIVETPGTLRLKTDPKVAVLTAPLVHRVQVTVTVTAPGVSIVTGTVLVRMAGIVKTATLRNGTATLTLKGLPTGKRTMTIRYDGSDTVRRLVTTRTVRLG
jgi:surface antigen